MHCGMDLATAMVDMPERVHLIGCATLSVDLEQVAARLAPGLRLEFLPAGLHDDARELRRRLQRAVDGASEAGECDLIAIGYGLCGGGTAGLRARGVPLALPRVSDCIAMLMGSDAAYRRQLSGCPGTYFVSAGWVESQAERLSGDPDEWIENKAVGADFDRLRTRYGGENADEVRRFLDSWKRNYRRAVFIDTGAGGRRAYYESVARALADRYGWRYEKLTGTHDLFVKLLTAESSSDEILVVPPGRATRYDADAQKLVVGVGEVPNDRS